MRYQIWYKDKCGVGYWTCGLWVTRASVDGWGPRSHDGMSLGQKISLLSISTASSPSNCVQLQALMGSCQKDKEETLQEAAEGGQEINYQTKAIEYIRMNSEEKISISVLLEYLKFEMTDVYTRL